MNPEVDQFIGQVKKWKEEIEQLRMILLDCQLTEELKWGSPCYSFQKNNLAILGGFKEYCVLSFFKGALLSDTHGILQKPGPNTQAARIIRFTGVHQILDMESVIRTYIYEAVEIEKAGLKVDFSAYENPPVPQELQIKFDRSPVLKEAFDKLTPGRQRAYLLYFSESKQSRTRESRIAKYIPQILMGKGINDCTCGMSHRMPSCDGTHKCIVKVSENKQQ